MLTHWNANLAAWVVAVIFTLYAGWLDGWTRRIPNWLTVPGLAFGIILHSLLAGWRGAVFSLEGAGLGLGILLPLVLLRALGAGDWKLMGAVGAFIGSASLVIVLLASVFVAGCMAIVQMIRANRVRETFRNVGLLLMSFFSFGLRAHPEISLDNPDAMKLPFGVAAAIGTLACFVAFQWGL
jgi:prepilin peptidase CpaA